VGTRPLLLWESTSARQYGSRLPGVNTGGTAIDGPGHAEPTSPEDDGASRTFRPAAVWAACGVACTALAAYAYTAWFVSGDARHVGTGTDALTTGTKVSIVIFEAVSVTLAVVAIVYVVRRCRRERRLCLDAMIVIAWAVTWWHDPLINWLRPAVFYNAGLANLGSWSEQVPGWLSANGRFHPEPILLIGTIYVWLGLFLGMLATSVMRRTRRQRPAFGALRIFLAAWAVIFCVDLVLEIVAIRTELVAYPSSIASLTLWAGRTYQLPLYEMMLWSFVLTATGALRFRVDERGRSLPERGADRIGSGRQATIWRLLAVIGFVQVVALGYDAVMVGTTLYAGPTDEYPTYLRTRQCGPGTHVACPGPDAPIRAGG